MASSEEVIIREAGHDDIDGIQDIEVDDVFENGEDDLLDELEDLLVEDDDPEDPDEEEDEDDEDGSHMFVAELNKEVVGFIMLEEIDAKGQGGQLCYWRVTKPLRGQKIGEKLLMHVVDYAKRELPEMKYIRASTDKPLPRKAEARQLCKVVYLYYEGDAKTLKTTLEAVPGAEELPLSAVVSYKPRHLRKMLDPAVEQHVLTQGMLLVDGDGYQLCKENLADFDEEEYSMFVDKNKPIQSISFASDDDGKNSAVYTIDVNSKNIDLIKCHLIKQMKRACGEVKGKITFHILANEFQDDIKAFCESIEGLRVVSDMKDKSEIISQIDLQ